MTQLTQKLTLIIASCVYTPSARRHGVYPHIVDDYVCEPQPYSDHAQPLLYSWTTEVHA